MPELQSDEKAVAPLIVIVRRPGEESSPEIHVFQLQDDETRCEFVLGERTEFRPPRAPKNGHLTILNVNGQVRLTIHNGKTTPAREVRPALPALPSRQRPSQPAVPQHSPQIVPQPL
jgi:hypothetical protein